MQKWKKVLIGVILLVGFALFTQYKKSAEPAWKVNKENFNVVKKFQDGMKQEYEYLGELKLVDKYGFLKDVKKEYPIESDYRTLNIEKIWCSESNLYLLYSVDLKERDESGEDVPKLSVSSMRLATEEGKELVAPARKSNNMTDYSDGFVYKHRLYRSLYISPSIMRELSSQEQKIFENANRIELQDTELTTKDGSKPFKNIALKVSNDNIYNKVFESKTINKTLSYGDNNKANIHSFEVTLYGGRLKMEMDKDDDVVGFTGSVNSSESLKESWQIIKSKEEGTFIPLTNYPPEMFPAEDGKTKVTFENSLHVGKKELTWTIPKADLLKINKQKNSSISKGQVIGSDHDTTITYEGLVWENGFPAISVSVSSKLDPFSTSLTPDWPYDENDININAHRKNIVSIVGSNGHKYNQYEITTNNFNEKTVYFIFFHQNGSPNPQDLPEDDLMISVSKLVYEQPLNKPVSITYHLPNLDELN